MECIGIIWNFSVFGMYEHDFYCHISQAHKHYHTTWTSSPFNINNFGSVGICYWAKLCRKHLYSIYHDRIFTFFLFSMRNHKSDLAHSTYSFSVRLVWSRLSLESIKTNLRTFSVLGLGFSIRWFTKSRKRKTIHLAGSISTSPFAFCSLVEFYKLSISLFVVISNYQQ